MPGSNSHHPADVDRPGQIATAISNGAVKLLREYTGRGPTKTRTYINSDYIAIVMGDILTKGERSLIADGHTELVLAARKAYQQTMGPALVELVETESDRRVVAFLSDNHLDPDIAVESFILEPVGDNSEASRVDRLTSADADI
jgi:uncharacterized protein YbcI